MQALKVAVVGAGPAGIYAADILAKSPTPTQIDLFERLPAPYGLVRYGVAPDHPRIKQIIDALYAILRRGDIRLWGNVNIGVDVTVQELRRYYDAVIFATGSDKDAPLDIEGVDLEGCFGAADFVSWFDGHPDWTRTWPLEAKEIAVLGAGNVALDVARVLAKDSADMEKTEVPANVLQALEDNPATDIHVFARRGPAQVKFSPLELRELGKQNGVDVLVYEEDFDFDAGSEAALRGSNQQRQVVKTLTNYAMNTAESESASQPGRRRIHIHMFSQPVQILGDEHGWVRAVRIERTKLNGDATVSPTGQFTEFAVQAVYRAVGYYGTEVCGVPFDRQAGVIPNREGRLVAGNTDASADARLYVTGWIKRGPVGLIGSTKSDAMQTVEHLLEDHEAGLLQAPESDWQAGDSDPISTLLAQKNIPYTTWLGWELLDSFERQLGQDYAKNPGKPVRERIKVVSRQAMTAISHADTEIPDLIGQAPAGARDWRGTKAADTEPRAAGR